MKYEWVQDSLPKSHTCNFQVEVPIYSSKDIFRRMLIQAIEESAGVEDVNYNYWIGK